MRIRGLLAVIRNVDACQRMLDRSNDVFDDVRMFLKKCGGHAMRSGTDENSSGWQVETLLRGLLRHVQIDLQKRNPSAVDRNLQLFIGNVAEEGAFGIAMEQRAEVVLPIGGEVVHDRDSTSRSNRRSRHMTQL